MKRKDNGLMSDEEQARALGLLFANIIGAGVWEVLSAALRHGGTCEFFDPNMTISTYLKTMFNDLKIVDGGQTSLRVNPSTLTIHKDWVERYALHAKEWETMRNPFDIFESYASAAVHLYGAVSQTELYELMLRYDPKLTYPKEKVMRTLTARAQWTGTDYRMEGDFVINREAFPAEREDSKLAIRELRKSRRDIDRWYPADRNELFKWAFRVKYERTPEMMGCELILRAHCKLAEDQLQEVLHTIPDLIAGGVPPDGVYRSLTMSGLLKKLSAKPRQMFLKALEAWMVTIRIQCLNGHTVQELRERACTFS